MKVKAEKKLYDEHEVTKKAGETARDDAKDTLNKKEPALAKFKKDNAAKALVRYI